MKVSQPDTFSRDKRKLELFLSQCELYARFNLTTLASSANKVLFGVIYLREAAADWFQPYLTDFLENNDPTDRETETNAIFDDWAEFKTRITRSFGDTDKERTAERAIQGLRQTTSAAKYSSEFQRHAARLMWDDTALKASFYSGLKDDVKDKLVRVDLPDSVVNS